MRIETMAVNYFLLEYHVNSMIKELMEQKGVSYESAMQKVLNSQTYAKLQEEDWLLEEGPLYVYGLLEKELNENPV